MKKNNNSLMLTILGGAIFCFVFLSLAFVFTKNTKVFKSDNISPINNIEIVEEEISLGEGDDGIPHCVSQKTAYTCPNGGTMGATSES